VASEGDPDAPSGLTSFALGDSHLERDVKEVPAFADPGGIGVYGIAIHLVLEPARGPRRAWWRLRPHVRDLAAERAEVVAEHEIDEENPLHSFEADILAYADPRPGRHPPFCTYAIKVPKERALVSVTFPADVTFRSEGWLVHLDCHGRNSVRRSQQVRTRRFRLCASRTDFRRSGLSVLHLVLGPDPSDDPPALNEYDLIKLMKLWQPGEGLSRDGFDATPVKAGEEPRHPFVTLGTGENAIDGSGADDELCKLANKVFKLENEPGWHVDKDGLRAGTVQVVHDYFKKPAVGESENVGKTEDVGKTENVGKSEMFRDIEGVLKDEGADEPSDRLIALGGLVCGLLDFAEIDGDELADVFRETIHEEQSVRSFFKGTLFSASGSDRALEEEELQASIGLNPYLLIPHAVLLHNEYWLADAVEQLDDNRGRGRQKLEATREDVGKTLSERLVQNVFYYHDERRCYEELSKARGLDVRERAVRGRVEEMAHKIQADRDRDRDLIAVAIAGILLAFTLGDAIVAKHSIVYVIVVAAVALLAVIAVLLVRREV
jgi:hypothetical protein